MEKVWSELKKIEAKAEEIRSEATAKAKQIGNLSQQEAEELIATSKSYADEEAKALVAKAAKEAAIAGKERMRNAKKETKKLRLQASENMEKAVDLIVQAVVGEGIGASDKSVR